MTPNTSKIEHLSFSKLVLFSQDMSLFRAKYITKTLKDKKADGLNMGSLVDLILFTPNKFHDKYIIDKEPLVSGLMGTFIEAYALLKSQQDIQIPFEIAFLKDQDIDLLRCAYKDANFKIDFEIVWNNFNKEPKHQEYFTYLYNKHLGVVKTYISDEEYTKAESIAKALKENKFTRDWFNLPGEYQKEISWLHDQSDIPFLSFLDALKIDDTNKIIYIDDVKTTSKKLINFHETIEEYRYDWQAALYKKAVEYLINAGKLPKYKIISRIIGVETYAPYRSLIIEFTPQSLYNADIEINKVVNDLIWHLETGIWDFPRYIYNQNGIIKY